MPGATLSSDAPRLPRPFRTVAIASLTALVAAGLTVVPPAIEPAAATGDPQTFLVSRTDSGTSSEVSITPDGQRVAFTSTASDLVAGDVNGVSDVFIASASQGAADPFADSPVLISTPDA